MKFLDSMQRGPWLAFATAVIAFAAAQILIALTSRH